MPIVPQPAPPVRPSEYALAGFMGSSTIGYEGFEAEDEKLVAENAPKIVLLREQSQKYAELITADDQEAVDQAGAALRKTFTTLTRGEARRMRDLSGRQLAAIVELFKIDDIYAVMDMISSLRYLTESCLDSRLIGPELGNALTKLLRKIPADGDGNYDIRQLLKQTGSRGNFARSHELFQVLLEQDRAKLVSEMPLRHPDPAFTREHVAFVVSKVEWDPKDQQVYFLFLLSKFAENDQYRDWAIECGVIIKVLIIGYRSVNPMIRGPAMRALNSLVGGNLVQLSATQIVQKNGVKPLLQVLKVGHLEAQRDVQGVLVSMFQWLDPDEPEREVFYKAVLGDTHSTRYFVNTRGLCCDIILAWILVEHPEADLVEAPTIINSLKDYLVELEQANQCETGIADMVEELINMLEE